MSQAKHTPGPWPINYDNSDHYAGGQWYDIGGVAEVRFRYRCTVQEQERATANARLIAAAPTMYSYIETKALNGDDEAKQILEAIHASR